MGCGKNRPASQSVAPAVLNGDAMSRFLHISVRDALALLLLLPATVAAQTTSPPADDAVDQNATQAPVAAATVTCSSKPGERSSCAADTSKGVVLLRSMGEAPCLLGRTWGYDQTSVWVSDGCSAEFVTGVAVEPETTKPKPPSYVPNVGFLLVDDDKGPGLFPALQLRAVSEPAESRRVLRRRLRQHAHR